MNIRRHWLTAVISLVVLAFLSAACSKETLARRTSAAQPVAASENVAGHL